jgi:protocatechuate 3,4-dioxygenase beta subunit
MDLFNFLPSFGSRKTKRHARKPKTTPRAQLQIENLEARLVMDAAAISGFVYADANNNGLFDPGEKPIANSSIQLKNAQGTVIGQTTTDANGFYKFTTDSTIDTSPAILAKTATIPTTGTDWTQSLSVPKFDPSLGTLTSIDIVNAGTFTSSIKVESLDGGPSTIIATVSGTLTLTGTSVTGLVSNASANKSFSASAFDGTIDFGGSSGHDFGSPSTSGTNTITLSDASSLAAYTGQGNLTFSDVAHATSSASGAGNLLTQIGTTANAQLSVVYHYIPSNAIKPGNYVIVQTAEPAGYMDGKESSQGVVQPNSIGTDSIPVVFTGSTSSDNDFGEVQPASLSGFVYLDTNDNGIKENGEAAISGVTVKLTGTSDAGPVSLTTTTAADGSYQFAGLRPGVYSIQETQPAGYMDGKDTLGSLSGSAINDLFSSISVASGANGINYNFGELLASSLAGKVYVDANNNGALDPGEAGIGSVTLTLTGIDDQGNPVSATITTAADGTYSFNNIRPGTFKVVETQPAAYLDGQTTAGSVGGVAGVNQISSIVLGSGTNAVHYNFGEVVTGSLSGRVYYDANDNGALDSNETGISGVTVTLTGTNDQGAPVSLTTTSAADGSYTFSKLRPGTYKVVETQPPNFLDGHTTAGSAGGTADVNQISGINLPVSTNATAYNFGEVLAGSLSGFVWYDPNNNGVKDPTETGISKVTITLTGMDDQGHAVSAVTQTADDGSYAFVPLRPGSYGITETQPSNFDDGKMSMGTAGGQMAKNQFLNIPLKSGQNGTQYNFGEVLNPTEADSNPFVPINVNLTFLSKLQLLSNSAEIQQQATQLAYYIDGVYSVTLGRHADVDGLSYFTMQLLRGAMTRQAFVSYMMGTQEHMASQINAVFLSVLGRNADSGAINYFVGLLSSGVSINDITAGLLASAEFQATYPTNQAYVQGLYKVALGRAPSANDLTFWQAQLDGGQQRVVVAEAILHSSEALAKNINQDYVNILGRNADPASLNQWVSMVQNGSLSEAQVATALMASDEFYTRVMIAAHLI